MINTGQRPSTPYIAASRQLREITPVVFGLSVVLTILLTAANAYLGMFAGMTVSASIPAAVISMAALRLFRGNILENNAVQTSASAGESLAAGVIFTLPAMILLGAWTQFSYWETTLLAGLGGVLGVLFTIPLRRALIIEEPLEFPEGTATAEVLKVGDSGGAGIRIIGLGALLGGMFKLGATGVKLWSERAFLATRVGDVPVYLGANLSPALIAVGYIVGLNISLLVVAGGVINWLVAIPIVSSLQAWPDTVSAETFASSVWSGQTRYLGVGAMLVGGFWTLAQLRTSLVKGIRAGMAAYRRTKQATSQALLRTEREFPMPWVLALVLVCAIPLYFLFHHFTHRPMVAAFMAVFMLVFGFLFSAVAAYMAGLVGSSNNPVSGVTIATILTAALVLLAFGLDSTLGPAASIFIGGVVCCAAAIGGDNMQDLKAGYLLGATPLRQQIMQLVGVGVAAAVLVPVLNLLHQAYSIGSAKLPAPQAGLMSAVASGVFRGNLPWGMISIGASIAVVVIVADMWLARMGAKFRMPVLAVAVGLYLPLELAVPIGIGGGLAYLAHRRKRQRPDNPTDSHNGLLFAAGLITGEALVGVGVALPVAISKNTDILAPWGSVHTGIPGVILLAAVSAQLYRIAVRRW